jgi:hypothetical protein
MSVLDPENRRVFELPSPFSSKGRGRFRVVGRGLRYQFVTLTSDRQRRDRTGTDPHLRQAQRHERCSYLDTSSWRNPEVPG